MKFEKAKQLLLSGVPIKHPQLGTVYQVCQKESFFIKTLGNMCQKITVDQGHFPYIYAVNAPFSSDHTITTTLDMYNNTSGWELTIKD